MKTCYCIVGRKNDYLCSVFSRLSGKNGGRMTVSFTEKILSKRSPPLCYDQFSEAQALLNFIKTQISKDTTEGMEIVQVDYKSRSSISIKRLESGLTTEENGTLT